MCGVCGVIQVNGDSPVDTAVVASLNQDQRHRGPDGDTAHPVASGVLGHTRLAVVDLSDGGRQPFTAAAGAVCLVFNGEIYNHTELRSRYRLAVPQACDGAVLAPLWERLGPAMFRQLRGMYAIAVYDQRDGTLTLARDPFGIKPLYWTRTADGQLAFASQARTLLRLGPRPQLDPLALRHYLTFGALTRDQSPFAGIEAVPANGWLQWRAGAAPRIGTVDPDLFTRVSGASEPGLRHSFLETVAAHLHSDVPVALLLSAGIDSAAVAWAAHRLGQRLLAVTVDPGTGPSERSAARQTAIRFGHRHEVAATDLDEELIERYFDAMQRPSLDGLNTFLVSRAIAGYGMKVALSGVGGDELLAGYRTFRLLPWLPMLRATDAVRLGVPLARWCGGGRPKAAALLHPTGPRDAAGLAALARRVLSAPEVNRLAPALPGATPLVEQAGPVAGDRTARALSVAELTGYLGGTLLPDADAFSMDWSVELRVPYVDAWFAQAALAADPKRGVGKRGFAEALDDEQLRAIARRPKRGFALPMDAWMRSGPLARRVADAGRPDAPVRRVLCPSAVDRLLATWREGRCGWSRAWLLVSLDGWLRSLGGEVTAANPDPVRQPQWREASDATQR